MEVIPTDLFLLSLTTEMVNREKSETILLSEEDMAFGVVKVVVTIVWWSAYLHPHNRAIHPYLSSGSTAEWAPL